MQEGLVPRAQVLGLAPSIFLPSLVKNLINLSGTGALNPKD